jgi:hypothetical protein
LEHPRIHGVNNLDVFRDGLRVLRIIVHEPAASRRRSRRLRRASWCSPASQKGQRTQPVSDR